MKNKGCVFLLAQPLLHHVDVVVVREGRCAPLPPIGMTGTGAGMGGMVAAGMCGAAAGMGMSLRRILLRDGRRVPRQSVLPWGPHGAGEVQLGP